MDREKVIKGLECCTNSCSNGCPYADIDDDCQGMLCKDALALLKEDCHNCKLECLLQKYDKLKEKYDALLNEQKAIEPIHYHRSDGTIFKYECRKCRTKIFKMDLFCRHCGQAVKWDV